MDITRNEAKFDLSKEALSVQYTHLTNVHFHFKAISFVQNEEIFYFYTSTATTTTIIVIVVVVDVAVVL
jgi:hypothetical protein